MEKVANRDCTTVSIVISDKNSVGFLKMFVKDALKWQCNYIAETRKNKLKRYYGKFLRNLKKL